MKVEDISVAIQLFDKAGSKRKALADVTIPIEGLGLIEIFGSSVVEANGGALAVLPPSRQGQKPNQYFETIALRGRIKAMVTEAVLAEYQRIFKAKNK
jgi:hypothetical protein